jgi:hypothetical protein
MVLIDSLKLFDVAEPTFHAPYGSPIQDYDFVYLPLRKQRWALAVIGAQTAVGQN